MNKVLEELKRLLESFNVFEVALVIAVVFTSFRVYELQPYLNHREIYEKTSTTIILDTVITKERKNSAEQLIEVLSSLGVKYPRVVLCQMIHETGWFESRVCKENNNMMGMKRTKRPYLINKDGMKKPKDCPCFDWDLHACYPTLEDGIRDFTAWQALVLEGYKRKNGHYPKTENDYFDMLDCLVFPKDKNSYSSCRRYASDKEYTKNVRKLLRITVSKFIVDDYI